MKIKRIKPINNGKNVKLRRVENRDEKELTRKLKLSGCKVYHPFWPDLLVIKPNGDIMFVEIKTDNNTLSIRQKETIELFKSLGFNIEVLKSDGTLFIEEVNKPLKKIKRKYIIKYPIRNKEGIPFRIAELMKD
jgi:hypothetical protein